VASRPPLPFGPPPVKDVLPLVTPVLPPPVAAVSFYLVVAPG
jgi:hypothetical protein